MDSRQAKRREKREQEKKRKKIENIINQPDIKGKTKEGEYKHAEPSLVKEGKDLPMSSKRKIASDVNNYKVDLSKMKDTNYSKVTLQNFALVSFLSPFTNQECRSTQKQPKIELESIFKKYRMPQSVIERCWNIIHDELSMAIKVRGAFNTIEDAQEHLRTNIGVGDRVDPWVIDMYEYKMIPPNRYADKTRLNVEYGDQKTNEFYQAYIKQQEQVRREKDERIELFKERMELENQKRLEGQDETENKIDILADKLREFQKDKDFNTILADEVKSQVKLLAEKSGMDLKPIFEQIEAKSNIDEDVVLV